MIVDYIWKCAIFLLNDITAFQMGHTICSNYSKKYMFFYIYSIEVIVLCVKRLLWWLCDNLPLVSLWKQRTKTCWIYSWPINDFLLKAHTYLARMIPLSVVVAVSYGSVMTHSFFSRKLCWNLSSFLFAVFGADDVSCGWHSTKTGVHFTLKQIISWMRW